MKYSKLLILAYILPFLAGLNACQQGDKNTYKEQSTGTQNYEPLPTTDEKSKTNTLSAMELGLTDMDATNKKVNYQQPQENYNTQDKRMIIRQGTMSVEVDNFAETDGKVKQIVNGVNGYVTNSTSLLNASGKKQGTITIRVQSDKFDMLVDELGKVGKVMNQNISGKDVTEEYMDSEARLKTQRELESRLLQLLAEKTANLTAVVEVEQKLAGVRENIEKTEGRMKFLKDQAAYSTITVSVFEPAILNTSSGGGFFHEIGQGVKKGLSGFTSVISGIITFVIALSPVLAIFGVIIYITVRIIRKRKLAKA
jgi:VIT1/CCC1 family predicted Fe2+/Mn2+ transporter